MEPLKNRTWLLALLMLLFCSANLAVARQYVDVEQAAVNFNALQPGQEAVAAVVVKIKSGFHIQSHTPHDKILIASVAAPDANPTITFLEPVYPPAEEVKYENSDASLSVYTGEVTFFFPFQVQPEAKAGLLTVSGRIHYQACDANGCFQPADALFRIDTKIVPLGESIEPQNAALFKNLPANVFSGGAVQVASQPTEPEEKLFGRFTLAHNSYLLAFLAAFIAGIIFNAVPCVLPVLPLKAIGFYEVSQHNRARCLAFGAVFSLGLIASFAALALLIVVYKKVGWGEIYSNAWFNAAIVLILLAMAIGTFGAFSVQLPVGIYNITPRHDTYFGNFLFGILTAILSTPCTFGLFVSLLVWAGTQPTAIGVSLVMTVGAGMAFPYFLLSAFPELARRFPRTGPWSELVKQAMSFLLLGSAVFFARRFVQPYTGEVAFWWTLFGVAAVAGLFLIVRTLQITRNAVPRLIVTAIALLVVASSYLIVHELMLEPFAWTAYSDRELESAQSRKRVVVVDFTATWCTNCKFLEVHTLHSPEVVKAVKSQGVEMIKADLTSETAPGWSLIKKNEEITSIPLTLVYGPAVDKPIKLTGIYSPAILLQAIKEAGKKAVAAGDGSID